jgi:hypothetical protein
MLDTFRGFDDSLLGRRLLRFVILSIEWQILVIYDRLSSKPRNVSSIEWQILVIYDQVDRHQNHEMCLAYNDKS